jgi:excisionase family DNA binding protein
MLLTVPEAMSLLRVSRGTLYNLVNDGAFPVVKIGGTRFKRADLLDYIDRSTIRVEAA